MKKLFTLIALTMAAISTYAADTSAAQAVAGTYTVHVDVNFLYVSRYVYTYTDETVTITANSDGTAAVTYTNDTWGTYTVGSATVTANSDGTYSLGGEGTCTMAGHSSTSEYVCDLTATIADGAISECVFYVESVMGGTTVTCASGDAPAFAVGSGDHTVYADVDFLYVSRYYYTYTDETVTLTVVDTDMINVSYTNETWGTYTVDSATVTDNGDGSYTISGSGTATMAGHSSTSEYYCDLTATVTDGVLTSCEFTVESVMGGTTVTCVEGSAPAFEIGSGDHRVYAEVMFAYISTPMCNAYDTVSVSITGAETVSIAYSNATWGDYAISDATVTANDDGTYSITGEGTAEMAGHSGTSEYYCELTATVDTAGVLSQCTFYMEAVMGGTSIVCVEGSAPAYAIADDYACDMDGVFAYGTLESDSDTVSIAYIDTELVTLSYTSDTWGEFVIDSMEVVETDEGYTLAGVGTVSMDDHSGGTNDYEFDFEGTISLDLSDYTFVITMEIMGGTTITLTPVGSSDDETGISAVTVGTGSSVSDGAIYDLSGRRVDSSYKGIVIRNGKKYIQK